MYTAITANKRNTIIIMAIFVLIIGALGWIFSNLYQYPDFLYIAFIVAGIYAAVQYFMADKLAVAVNGAHQVTKQEQPRLYRTVENISIANGLPMPKVYVIDDPAPNAFATGRDPSHAIVCATTGLLDLMADSELQGVIAHEFGHIKNYDIRLMMIVFGLVGAIGLITDLLSRMLWFDGGDRRNNNSSPIFLIVAIAAAILAPVVALLVQLAISRQREYLADSTGALTTHYPEGLVSALRKIEQSGSSLKRQNTATAHLFFANPLRGGLSKFFSTHPPIADRIARLQQNSVKL